MSFGGISLLHRCAGGWRNAGEVALDAPDLSVALSGLRGAASRLEPGPLYTKLVIPNEQIRYLSIETGAVDAQTRDARVREALEGATPYAVADLAYDISVDGATTHIAAVARETLAEAESFAVEHAFGPLCCVAIPGRKPFLGEPFFGPTRHAVDILPAGQQVEPDGIAIVVVGPAQFPVDGAPAPEPYPEPHPQPVAPPTPAPTLHPEPTSEPTPAPAQADAPVAFSSRRRKPPAAAPAAPPPPEPVPEPTPEPVHFAHRPPPEPEPEPVPEPVFVRHTPEPPSDPVPAAPSPPPLVAHPAPEHADVTSAPPISAPMRARALAAAPPPDTEAAPAGGGFLRRRVPALNDEPEIDVSAMPPRLAAAVLKTNGARAEPDAETDRMTVFGARQQAGQPKNRHMGLILTVVLLLVLAGVAAWASIFLDDGVAGVFGRDRTEPVTAALPQDTETGAATPSAAQPRPETPGPAPASVQFDAPVIAAPVTDTDNAPTALPGPEAPVALAALDPGTTARLTSEDSAVMDAPRAPVATGTAQQPRDPETRYAVTGIWSQAPAEPDTPSIIGLDDLYIGSIDNHDLSQDAVAQPELASLQSDGAIGTLTSPIAPDTAFDLDDRGLVRPTPQGALNPDGVLVYLGRPRPAPPATPDRTEPVPEEDTLRDRLAGFRPRLRPDDLSEQTERGQLGGLTRNELALVRPKLRPETVKQTEESADETATAQAVAFSTRPATRPTGFTAQVETQKADPDNEVQVASVAPQTVTPKIPTKASVSRQATLNNAIDLRQVNLIGVYGTPSNRRALVRLPSGRYKKVQVGDRIDGGEIVAIGDSELRYQKGGRNLILKIPSG